MNEKLLQFIWQFQYFNKVDLLTNKNENLQVLHSGFHNTDQGPDFSDARVLIDHTTWAGAVELHIKSSDWQKHNHQLDERYKNVILHVVWEDDLKGPGSIPIFELKNRVSKLLLHKYDDLMNNSSFIPCEKSINKVKNITLQNWKDRLLAERLMRKAALAESFLVQTKQHWAEIFWWMLARNFGMKINADAFEQLAKSLPINLFAKHKNNQMQIEAMLMGQSGLLNKEYKDDYPRQLQSEYKFLKSKYKLKGIMIPLNFLRTRPGNFPTIRLAQLAMLIDKSVHLFSRIKDADSLADVQSWFQTGTSGYWDEHYQFDELSVFKKKKTGKSFIDNILINTIVPVLFAYGDFNKEQVYKDKALQWLENINAEKNKITNGFVQLGLKNNNAFDSQALLQLKTEYCEKKRCLDCGVGNAILKSN